MQQTPFLLFVVRGLLLWIAVPVETVLWVLLLPLFAYKRVSLWNFLGWADQNLIAALQGSLLRPFFSERATFVSVRDMTRVTHRLRVTDPA